MHQFIVNPEQRLFTTHASDEGELLRLVSEVKILIQGAAPEALARLGAERLTALKGEIEREQAAIRSMATKVKMAINSSLSVDELANLGTKKLQELGAKAGIKAGGDAREDEWASYSINETMDAAYKA